ncbi:DUF3114 domain-containing protein [Streptococcus merionis]|nr:DUF3114 domain-containing protein [Streptococcus merionis]
MNIYGLWLGLGLIFLGLLVTLVWRRRQMMATKLSRLPLNDDYQASYHGFLDAQDRDIWRGLLLEQVKILHQLGWSKSCIEQGYLSLLKVPEIREEHLSYLQKRLVDSQLFGSLVFQKMWHVGMQQSRMTDAQVLLKIAMQVTGMPDDLSGRLEETQELLRRFDPDLEPGDAFWKHFAQTVQRAFPGQSLAGDGKLNRQIHQFRYLISSQQAQWLRQHFRKDNDTDAQALAKYIRDMDQRDSLLEKLGITNYDYYFEYSLTDSSRLHNKIALDRSGKTEQVIYPDGQVGVNFKILLHFHTEFILDEAGHFLNEVDAERVTENGVLNGASFNYANRNGAQHSSLDVSPVNVHDPKFRKKLARQKKLRYISPNRTQGRRGAKSISDWELSYFNPRGYFSQNGKSAAQRVQEAAKAFEKLL